MSEEYCLSVGNANAHGVVTTEGFVIYKGAVVSKTVLKSIGTGAMKLRNELIVEEKVKDIVTTDDILFSSSSAVATFAF